MIRRRFLVVLGSLPPILSLGWPARADKVAPFIPDKGRIFWVGWNVSVSPELGGFILWSQGTASFKAQDSHGQRMPIADFLTENRLKNGIQPPNGLVDRAIRRILPSPSHGYVGSGPLVVRLDTTLGEASLFVHFSWSERLIKER